ncbi:hypothetical protein RRX38_14260 [Pseudomonas sp. DTU_2021_1001937_2_SI_NGA_ILE_001]|uniref:hypothetical protein n=1 Tax=Pseudomonas sp. DTU_2021_1001937_2_SI_NGA_ILE_001 TaxID=3077589 RepID=UPI0028FC10FD|nr:hypothetical protein [Pseudomonas sp. DTU_2021_1001937_2_SI_NGA_ILE_001]WNW12257.1 hypothetical protein RRX38_14260 [Pseudomonas sp. DTU_2021_1001937_2_SI_NGA_ILE_001]
MMPLDSFSIAWDAPIIPGVSLAGIPLHASAFDLETVLSKYLIDKNSLRYRFEGGPDLFLSGHGLDERSNGGYSFSIFDDEIVSELKKGVPALSVLIRSGRVYAVKVYDFSFPGEPAHRFVYKGLLSECIGLGSPVSDILPFTSLEFDEAEEWFYTGQDYGALEVTGWGVPLEEQPNQLITAICVIQG